MILKLKAGLLTGKHGLEADQRRMGHLIPGLGTATTYVQVVDPRPGEPQIGIAIRLSKALPGRVHLHNRAIFGEQRHMLIERIEDLRA